jgi:23S rRNA pseudouridine2605 synthase
MTPRGKAPRRSSPAGGSPGGRGTGRRQGSAPGAAPGGAPGAGPGAQDPAAGLSPAELARARAAAASLAADFDDDDDWGGDGAGERDSLTDVPGGVRLQKVLAAAGVGSRRHCEELIGAGRVEVDGEIVRRFGARVDPQHQIIRVAGRRIPASEDLVYVALNKPAGVLTSMSDNRGRATMTDLLGDTAERLFHVGRLDYDTEGLMLLTNDGELAHRLMHPRFGVPKTYLAEVPGPVPRDLGRQLLGGIELEDGVASADKFRVVEQAGGKALVEITLHEGRKHIVRRMLAAAGHPVSRLVRTQVGPVSLGSLRPGTTRPLSVREVGDLYAAVGL